MTHPHAISDDDALPHAAPTTPAQRQYIETLFRTSYQNLCAYATCMGAPNVADAEDAVQRAFENLLAGHRCLAEPDTSCAVMKYLYATIDGLVQNQRRNAAVDTRHREHNTRAVQTVVGPSSLATPDALVVEAELDTQLRRIFQALPPQQRQILLRTRQGYTYAQVAAQLGIGVSTVNTQIVRALKRFRRELRDWFPDDDDTDDRAGAVVRR